MRTRTYWVAAVALAIGACGVAGVLAQSRAGARGAAPSASVAGKTITEADCSAATLGTSIPVSAIGEPVSAVTLAAPKWVPEAGSTPAYCSVDGAMAPAVPAPNARSINFRVILPAAWTAHAAQLGGGGMDGMIPNLLAGAEAGTLLQHGFATYGSDSGHQMAGPVDWVTNDEAIRNLGYMQMKKTHDAAMVLMERLYGARPRYNYFIGTSQGGREALTVAQRYPADYNGIAANVPIVSFSSLMLGPELIRIQEKPEANWVTPDKVEAIRAEFIRQCDGLDGLEDGVINNYKACRAIFDVTEGAPGRHPWASKRCPNGVDPKPSDTSANACFTDGQISTLEVVYSRYKFATPLANGVKTFGMWVPNTDPAGSGLIATVRYRGQEGAPDIARMHSHLGVLGVTGFLMRDPAANPLDYVEGGPLNARRVQLSGWLDSTDPDLSPFAARGGKMIVAIGTNDTLASPGAQLDYYQSLIDKMGAARVNQFARLYVIPQVNHGFQGRNYSVDGNGKAMAVLPVPSFFNRVDLLTNWVEHGVAPGAAVTVTSRDKSLPLCTYPRYPKYIGGSPDSAASYRCS